MIIHKLRPINEDQRGFTLLEILAAIGISAIIGVFITLTIFQVITGSARTNNRMTALSQVQSAGFWFSQDAQMAQDVNPPDGGFPLTFTWNEWGDGGPNGNQHNVVYTLLGGELQRQHVTTDAGGAVIEDNVAIVAEYVTGASCNVTGSMLNFTITATLQGQSETRTYNVVRRPEPGSWDW
jgi:prepilin-type N-terminal cleavage/methylation domain-containing protein